VTCAWASSSCLDGLTADIPSDPITQRCQADSLKLAIVEVFTPHNQQLLQIRAFVHRAVVKHNILMHFKSPYQLSLHSLKSASLPELQADSQVGILWRPGQGKMNSREYGHQEKVVTISQGSCDWSNPSASLHLKQWLPDMSLTSFPKHYKYFSV
jgi:hypothetical protein